MSKSAWTTGEIARQCQVTSMTVLNWIKNGRLRAHQTPGGHYRVREGDLRDFLERHDMLDDVPISSNGRGRKILVVDDEPRIVNFVIRILRRRFPEFEFAVALDGYDAGFQAATFRPDLILLDIRMPGMDGVEVCRKIKTSPETMESRILVITAFPEGSDLERMLDFGAEEYLMKPFGAEELIGKVASLMEEPGRFGPEAG